VIDCAADAVDIGDTDVTVRLAGGGIARGRLAVGADGRQSLCRTAAGLQSRRSHYPQTALTFNLAHSRPHRDMSTEFHTDTGPFTLVPLPGRRSSLVWVLDRQGAARFSDADDAHLCAAIERQSHSMLGKITLEPGRGAFPLTVETADSFAAPRVALVGEAAHVIPPIGAQGLNLGLRDAATIAELVVLERRSGRDVGSADLLARYHASRLADVTSRTVTVDLLNRSLLSGFLPLHGARGLGLFLLDRIGVLRRAVMREGVMPAASQPCLMRGEPLHATTD
jgi:2-octaprenyl-6-methoxyphenol hydroxylase